MDTDIGTLVTVVTGRQVSIWQPQFPQPSLDEISYTLQRWNKRGGGVMWKANVWNTHLGNGKGSLLEKWFSNSSEHQNHLGGLLKHHLRTQPKFLIQQVWDGAWEFAFLTSSQMTLMLSVLYQRDKGWLPISIWCQTGPEIMNLKLTQSASVWFYLSSVPFCCLPVGMGAQWRQRSPEERVLLGELWWWERVQETWGYL